MAGNNGFENAAILLVRSRSFAVQLRSNKAEIFDVGVTEESPYPSVSVNQVSCLWEIALKLSELAVVNE